MDKRQRGGLQRANSEGNGKGRPRCTLRVRLGRHRLGAAVVLLSRQRVLLHLVMWCKTSHCTTAVVRRIRRARFCNVHLNVSEPSATLVAIRQGREPLTWLGLARQCTSARRAGLGLAAPSPGMHANGEEAMAESTSARRHVCHVGDLSALQAKHPLYFQRVWQSDFEGWAIEVGPWNRSQMRDAADGAFPPSAASSRTSARFSNATLPSASPISCTCK